ncbi:HAD family hydrolase [Kibdelosporangium aridum]|uniref:Haloacid dehalogenase superfamily, subfamily IA, variant 3 with third motif having DD or ED n=1 Tax=Kibdelosporangium aridum TaxID=2030 RepID=A0A1W2A9S1_KIBAR|nr:HAD family phosphatase [Kibdelosporangium aridum]SMC57222.1 haloacid dehalogenase superfamily, subfamily IA, variant 3 with third motif having DD or ED [Kibdelosporangium aridum]
MQSLAERIEHFPDPRALIFDLDGTLVDTKANNRRALFATFATQGVRAEDMPSAPEGTGFVDWCALLVAEGLLSPDVSVPALQEICEKETLRTIREVRPIEAVAEFARWAERRFPLAIATGSSLAIVDPLLAATGLRRLFDVVVTRDQVANGKPAPDLFLRAAELLDVPPARCVVLEDTQVGLDAASRAGMSAMDVRPYR